MSWPRSVIVIVAGADHSDGRQELPVALHLIHVAHFAFAEGADAVPQMLRHHTASVGHSVLRSPLQAIKSSARDMANPAAPVFDARTTIALA